MPKYPEDKAQNEADDDRTGQRKGDSPALPLPGEVTWKAAERDIKARREDEEHPKDDQEYAKAN